MEAQSISAKVFHGLAQLVPLAEIETELSTYQAAADAVCGCIRKNTARYVDGATNNLVVTRVAKLELVDLCPKCGLASFPSTLDEVIKSIIAQDAGSWRLTSTSPVAKGPARSTCMQASLLGIVLLMRYHSKELLPVGAHVPIWEPIGWQMQPDCSVAKSF